MFHKKGGSSFQKRALRDFEGSVKTGKSLQRLNNNAQLFILPIYPGYQMSFVYSFNLPLHNHPSNFSTDICGDGFQISRYGESLRYLLSVLRSDILLALLLLLVEHQPLLLLLLDGLLSQTLLVGTFLISICTVIGIFLISSFTLIGIFLISICTVTGIFLISIFAPG